MTPLRSIRVPEELWQAVKEKAKADGVTITSIISNALRDYVSK